MIALENMKRVDHDKFLHTPVADWNWKPSVNDLDKLDKVFIEASGSSTTTRQTYTHQSDHGENY